jgi:SAM-dependent methyltransferase
MDFGSAARDYKLHRRGFPDSFFARVPLSGRVLDLGAGTGTIARGYLAQGAAATAVDLSPAMLREAPDLPARAAARAEALPLRGASFDAIVAGQCWHWFDGARAAAECRRALRPGGRLVIAHFDYLADRPGVARDTEELILRYNPRWTMAFGDGRYERWGAPLAAAGFADVRSFFYDEPAEYTHESWRGRMRACNGAMAVPDAAERARLDADVARMLAERWPEPLLVPHRVFVISGTRAG